MNVQCSAMGRNVPVLPIAALLALFALADPVHSAAQDPEQYARDQYQGKTFVVRGFYSASHLRYGASAAPDKTAAGDWTDNGFVLVEDIHSSNDHLVIEARRLAVDFTGKQFELRPLTEPHGKNRTRPAVLKIEADFPQPNPSPEQVDALVSRIFLTGHDHLASLVPDYWQPCVRRGLAGREKNCLFATEILGVPGVATSEQSDPGAMPRNEDGPSAEGPLLFRVGNGVSPPRPTFSPEPEFTESARVAKFHGTVTLGLTVNKEGVPRNVRILNPLGSGLDAKAVQAVQSWKFEPARKDGHPVAVEIAVEVDFHLY